MKVQIHFNMRAVHVVFKDTAYFQVNYWSNLICLFIVESFKWICEVFLLISKNDHKMLNHMTMCSEVMKL